MGSSKLVRLVRFIRDFKQANDFPRVANYEITSRCNLSCSHCYWRKTLASRDELTDSQWRELFRDHRARGVSFAFLTGGEPSLRPAVIEAADRIFPGLAIATNGMQRVAEHIRRRIFVSLDGPREVHDRIRGAGVFDRVIANVRGDSRVILSPTLSTANRDCIEELVAIARETAVAGITFSLYTSHRGQDDPLLLAGAQLEETTARLRRAWKRDRQLVYLTPRIIATMRDKAHARDCFFRGRNFISLDAALRRKEPCVLGRGVDCRTCGCIVPVVSHAMKRAEPRAWILVNRMFPQAYFRNGTAERPAPCPVAPGQELIQT